MSVPSDWVWTMRSISHVNGSRRLPSGVIVHAARLLGDVQAVTDGRSIWVDERLTAIEQRCAIEHELVHIVAGHTGHEEPRIERRVRRETARRLLTLPDVVEAAKWAPNTAALAEELLVTPAVLGDFVDSLSMIERRVAENLLRAHWEGT